MEARNKHMWYAYPTQGGWKKYGYSPRSETLTSSTCLVHKEAYMYFPQACTVFNKYNNNNNKKEQLPVY